MKKIIFKDGTEITIRKFTREFANNQSGRMYLNATLTRDEDSFETLVNAASKSDNISSFKIEETNEETGDVTTTTFDGFVLDNIVEIHEVYSNDVTLRAYKMVQSDSE